MPLHVEDELAVAELRRGELRLEGGLGLELEEAAAPAGRRVGGVEREQRARCAAAGDQELAPARPSRFALRVGRFVREAVGGRFARESGTGTNSPLRSCRA